MSFRQIAFRRAQTARAFAEHWDGTVDGRATGLADWSADPRR
ncbi:hypothetical protein ACFR9U_10430 [Halorientalis brevis]|uniref:Uncharacterized protein n=1 Tax=Halorientalis brevis TaxID=1126241 RepID=A0ABD6CAM9_9EURY